MTHFIQQQHLHVSLNGTEEEGLALQNRLPDFCNDWLQKAIEQVLDRCAPADGRLYIEHLEIDVGTIRMDRLEQDMAGVVASALETAIREKAVPAAANMPDTGTAVQIKTDTQTAWEAFVYFLETGRFPWSFRLPPGETLETLLLKTVQDNALPAFAIAQLKKALAIQTARQRVVMQFSVAFLSQISAFLSPEIPLMVHRIHSESSRYSALLSFEKHLWLSALEQIANSDVIREAALFAGAVRWMEPLSAVDKVALGTVLRRLSPDLKDIATADLAVLNELRTIVSGKQPDKSGAIEQTHETKAGKREASDGNDAIPPRDASKTSENKQEAGTQDFIPSDSGAAPESLPKSATSLPETRETRTPDVFSIPEGEAIYIDNAGLVILHPFLALFFEALGVAREGELLHPQRALQLLHFLATGQETAPEHELVLPKVLCGLAPDALAETGSPLSETEKEEATHLLETVVRYWDALRDTSPDGLRGAFLCRSGSLSRRGKDWLLQVERMSHDILLEQLPWGISVVQLGWMEEVVWVEWG